MKLEELNQKMLDWFVDYYNSGIVMNFGFIKDKEKRQKELENFKEIQHTAAYYKRLKEIDEEKSQKEINQTMKNFDDVIEKLK